MDLVKRPVRGTEATGVTEDIAQLLTDDGALGRLAAEIILARDASVGAALFLMRCAEDARSAG